MGLLDDLKKQADAVKSQQAGEQALLAGNLRLVEQKMKQSFQYLNELLKQLAVLKPVNPLAFAIPGVGDFSGLRFAESFIDFRRKRIEDTEYFDTVNFHIRWQSAESLLVERDMPGTAQKVRDALWNYKMKFTEEEIKNARGVVERWRFAVQGAMVSGMKFGADHAGGQLAFSSSNILRLGTDNFAVPAQDIDEPLLEELARMLLGENSGFRKYRVAAIGR